MNIYRPSLRVAIAVPIALLFAATAALQAISQREQINQLIDRASVRLLDALTSTAKNHLLEYLDEPFRIQRDIGDAIARHRLYREGDLRPIYDHFRSVFHTLYLDRQQISVLSFGSRSGEYAGMRREVENAPFTLMLKDASTRGVLNIYGGDSPGMVVAAFPNYDPRIRPWYLPAARSGQSVWSGIYTNYDERAEISISATSPVFIGDELLGVMEATVNLDGLNRFLRNEPLRGKGLIFIADQEGRMVAHSEPGSVVAAGESTSKRGERILMSESSSPYIRAAAQQIELSRPDGGESFKLKVGGELFFCRISPYANANGINWRIIALVPEAELMGSARSASQRAMLWTIGFSLLGLLLVLGAISRVTAPIHKTAEAANKLALGESSSCIDENSALRETTLLMRAFNDMAKRMQDSFNHIREQLVYDSLTHLYTRHGLLEQVNWPEPRPAILSLIGLDAFRSINDTIGYATGNQLLQAVANRLREQLPETALLARVGGDEFVLLQFDSEDGLDAATCATRVQALFAQPFSFGADEIMVSASLGSIEGLLSAKVLPEWLRSASIALGEAKRRKHGHSVVFAAAMKEQSIDRARLANELRHAFEQDSFRVFYQPVIDLMTGHVCGTEALLRWESAERGMVPPSVFIPIAEESDLILTLGEWVLRTATRDIAQRLTQLPAGFDLHVNLSARQLIQSDFVSTLQKALTDSGLPAHHLTLELTESLLIEQDYVIEERLHTIRAMGIRIAIDDFGTGYSSLAYLSRLPLDCLKIDQTFVRKLSSSTPDAAIITAVLHMANGFDLHAIAEGVETAQEARLLRDMGCDSGQGYYFGYPAPLDQFNWAPRTVEWELNLPVPS